MLFEWTAYHRPAPRKSSALKNAWVNRWKNLAVTPWSEGQARHHVGQLRQRRVGEHPLDVVLDEGEERRPERRDRRDHAHDREHERVGVDEDLEQAPDQVDTRATIVAAWIRAETGVGPAIASGSQTCNGTGGLADRPRTAGAPPP